jgi:hypothetical protein
MRRGTGCAVLLAAAALSGCGGGGGDAQKALAETAANLGKIRSGVLHVELVVTPRGRMGQGPIGFRLDGPFSLGSKGSSGVLRIAYTQLAATRRATVTVISTGGNGYVETGGQTYELPAAQAGALRAAAQQLRSSGGLGRFRIDDWIRDPKLSDGGRVGGADTDRVRAGLDVVHAANDLISLARASGQPVPQLRGADAKQLAEAVRSSSFELYTGKKDRLLRRVRLEADLGLTAPTELRTVLGSRVGAHVRFVLGVDRPNSAVQVAAPANALPAAQMPRG